jgi:hypothetical protein
MSRRGDRLQQDGIDRPTNGDRGKVRTQDRVRHCAFVVQNIKQRIRLGIPAAQIARVVAAIFFL